MVLFIGHVQNKKKSIQKKVMTAGLGGAGLGATDNGYRISAGADKMSWN